MTLAKRNRPKTETVLRPVLPNEGITADYQRRLDALVRDMHRSVLHWVKAKYRAHEPVIAQDVNPAKDLMDTIRGLSARWVKNFDDAAVRLAKFFSLAAEKRSSAALRKILKDAGFSVEFRMTAGMRSVLAATINQNVGLIKSIPAQYLSQVEGLVMRSVQTGRDLHQLTNDLEKQFGVTRRRAAFIARDQNNKATAAFNRVRQLEVGLEEAVWVHSHGGHEPRPTHLAASRNQVRYDIARGWWDPHEKKFIQPGELPNCKCVGRPVIPGFS